MSESGGNSFTNAVKWSYVMDGGRQAFASVITLILAGTLGPEVFGTAAMALVYVLFIQMLQSQGMMPALIQRKDLRGEHLDSAFWAIMALSISLTAASIALSGWWADLNDLPQLREVIIVMSVMVPLQGLTIVQEAVVRRAMNFRLLAVRTNVSVVVGGALAIVAALNGAGVWAIVVQQVVTTGLGVALLWTMSLWRPSLRFSRDALGDLFGFASSSFAATLAVFVGTRADALMIGLFFGPAAVGIYRLAQRLVESVTDLTVTAFQGAALPELSRRQGDPSAFRARVTSIVNSSALLSLPLLAALAVIGPDVVELLGSESWGSTTAVIRILCVAGAVRAVTLFTGPMLQAMGRPEALARLSWFTAAASVGAFALTGTLFGDASVDTQVLALAASRALLHMPVLLFLYLRPVWRLAGGRAADIGRSVAPGLLAATGGLAAGLGVREVVEPLGALIRLVLAGGTTVGIAALIVLWLAPDVRSMLRRRWNAHHGEPTTSAPASEDSGAFHIRTTSSAGIQD